MTARRIMLLAALATLLLVGASLALAAASAGYSLPWFSVDGGGGTGSGGGYRVSGGIGQPDAGPLSGGGYTVQGGFWQGLPASANHLYLPVVQN